MKSVGRQHVRKRREKIRKTKEKKCTTLASGLGVETNKMKQIKFKKEHCQLGQQTTCSKKKRIKKSEKQKKKNGQPCERVAVYRYMLCTVVHMYIQVTGKNKK